MPSDPSHPVPQPLNDQTLPISDIPTNHSAPNSANRDLTIQTPPPSRSSALAHDLSSSSSSFNHGRFLPGTVLAGRYRIVAMIGRGGMGEVYRADDLTLGQTVALKFLPPALSADPVAVTRLHTEVRLAREIAHPNVCRVYDVGEVDGQPFLSMQYVDGENLASLLRRIGRLPHDKAIDLARQLATGLAAAHERGVLHRDLKPANIMLDARGKLLITDFGLSSLIDHVPADQLSVGTPAYMAPEQLAGQSPTVRSDLYSLGLVLYELFTGRPVHKAKNWDELIRMRDTFDPSSLTSSIDELDPVVHGVIMRCLEREPSRRPARALSVLAALPGGDPLAAALAAGETPSPEMVAAAGGTSSIPIRRGLAMLGAIAVPLFLLSFLNSVLFESMPPVPVEDHPAILADYAAQTLRALGQADPEAYIAWGMDWDPAYFAAADRAGASAASGSAGKTQGKSSRREGGYFWYRQSPRRLVPTFISQPITLADPPALTPGMVSLVFGPSRQLIKFIAIGPAYLEGTTPATRPSATAQPDPATTLPGVSGGAAAPAATQSAESLWTTFFEKAHLDPRDFQPAAPIQNPPTNSDRRFAWAPAARAGDAASSMRVEAASLAGKPVYFAVLRPWEMPVAGMRKAERSWFEKTFDHVGFFVRWTIWVVAAGLAIRNVSRARSDRRNAFRLAMFVFVLSAAGNVLRAAHQPPSTVETQIIFWSISQGLLRGGMAWLFYLALEPYVRRVWPDWLISWTRLMNGQARDPLVGRDLLGGLAVAATAATLGSAISLLFIKLGAAPPAPSMREVGDALRSTPSILAVFFWQISFAAITAVALPFVVAAVQSLTGSKRYTLPISGLILFIMMFTPSGNIAMSVITIGIAVSARLFALTRFGVLGLASAALGAFLFQVFPPVLDLGPWYAAPIWCIIAVVILLALYGFRIATQGQLLFQEEAA